ncbi:hypothetical protein PHLGIDRAFT_67628, partial [Phlebiopsis gigantea 11061_1 CR5-6]
IPDELADQNCATMGVEKLLQELNSILGTAYTLETPSLRDILEACIKKELEFGTAYGHLRPRWLLDFTKFESYMTGYEADDTAAREKALQGDHIINPRLPPRRRQMWAVSHSWMAPPQRQYVWTAVNARQWSVPIPDDVSLAQIRIELLNLGAEYVWLDVLCLRQNGRDADEEALRAAEWTLDVPTIGHVYHQGANQPVICYYSGLGRPFTVEAGVLAGERHWMNRAWTLQENREQSIVAGITNASPPFPPDEFEGDTEVARFARLLSNLPYEHPTNIFIALQAMQKRASVNPVDKIAGLAYVLQCNPLPVYKTTETDEDAWARLIECLPARYRGDILFQYPECGDGRLNWAPSWTQVLENTLPKGGGVYIAQDVTYAREHTQYRYRGYVIRGSALKGFEGALDPSPGNSKRTGQLAIQPAMPQSNGLSFDMVALHKTPIPDGQYTLISGRGMGHLEYWVVAKDKVALLEGVLLVEKVSVLRASSPTVERAIGESHLGEDMDIVLR